MKNIIYMVICAAAFSSCSIYRNYERPEDLPVDSLYRVDTASMEDSVSLGDISWEDLFTDPKLQDLIRLGLENNTDMQVAYLRVEQAKAQLTASKLSFLPSLNFNPSGTVSSIDGAKATKTYELPVQASWEIDLFGNLRNAKKNTQATLLQNEAYAQAVRSELIASIANHYYSLLMLDEQVRISGVTLDTWRDQVRTIEARYKVGEENENAVTQARAGLYDVEVTYNTLVQQQREVENSLCTMLGMTSRTIDRTSLEIQSMPENVSTGVPLRLLSQRPDVVQAEMSLAAAYYSTNQARSAFYPNLTLSGSAGWTNSLGQVVTNPGGLILSAVASLAQPIFNRGKLISNLKVSKAEEEIARLNYKQALLAAGQEVNDALFAIEIAAKNLDSHQKQCEELKRSLQVSEALYKTGNATYLELITARQSLLSAELNLVSDRFTRLQSVINLYNALGGGSR